MKKRLVSFAMIGILSLTAVGFGYAKWSSSVDANVTVNTGSLVLGIRDLGTNDDNSNAGISDLPIGFPLTLAGQPGADPQWGAGINGEGKDVAKFESVNPTDAASLAGNLDGINYYKSISETITNGYPYYGPSTTFEIANLGTIPAKLETVALSWDDEQDLNAEYVEIVKWTATYPDGTTKTGTGLDALQAALYKYQLHGGKVITVEAQFGIRQTDKAGTTTTPQKASGALTLNVTAAQWNEVQ